MTEPPPADWPDTVTCSGSPPKRLMYFCVHERAKAWSRRKLLMEPLVLISLEDRIPNAPISSLSAGKRIWKPQSPVARRDVTHSVLGSHPNEGVAVLVDDSREVLPSVTVRVSTAVDPDHDRELLPAC